MPSPTVAPIRLVGETTASPEAAWAALTDPAQVARWFAEPTPLGDGEGSAYAIDFGDGNVIDGVIRELIHGRRLTYTWQWRGQEPAATLVTWEVEALEGEGTRITLTHAGWDEAGADEGIRDDHAGYWEGYLADLLDLLDGEAAGG
jgi:uncharacterized protein YndB with AHSA1/START domain